MPRIFTINELDSMFQMVGFTRQSLQAVLLEMGPPVHLDSPESIHKWNQKVTTEGISTTGYCHRVTEAVYRMGVVPAGYKVHRKEDNEGSHWFFKNDNGEIIDLTADQFDNGYDYDNSEPNHFFRKTTIARKIAQGLGYGNYMNW